MDCRTKTKIAQKNTSKKAIPLTCFQVDLTIVVQLYYRLNRGKLTWFCFAVLLMDDCSQNALRSSCYGYAIRFLAK
jgi:hypothetical protein